jgi:hypothetical protein
MRTFDQRRAEELEQLVHMRDKRISVLEAENAALKARPAYTHGYDDGQSSRQGEIDALKAEHESSMRYFKGIEQQLAATITKLERAELASDVKGNIIRYCHHVLVGKEPTSDYGDELQNAVDVIKTNLERAEKALKEHVSALESENAALVETQHANDPISSAGSR